MPNPPITITPQSGNTLAQTLVPIQQNFNTINLDFAVDHVGYGSSANEGKHNQVTFPIHLGAIAPLATEIVLFNQNNALTGISDIWMQRGTAPAFGSNPIPITGSLQNPSLTNGWSYLPSGILLKWGTTSQARNTLSSAIPFPVAANIPVFNNVFMMQVSQTFAAGPSTGDLNVAISVGNVTALNFQVFPRAIGLPGSGNVSIFYYALGN